MQINSFNSKIFIETSIGKELPEYIDSMKPGKIFIVMDEHTREYCLPHLEELLSEQKVHLSVIGQGERNKHIDSVAVIWNDMQRGGADRDSLLIGLGGGMLLDVAGFAAATFKRGIRQVNIPTTLLSMVDASVGGKNGFNFNGFKNHIGVFRSPDYVFIYPEFLKTLQERQLYAGWAEMLKHGLIQSRRHFDQLIRSKPDKLPQGEMAKLIRDSVDIKNFFITRDPYEDNVRKALNFGHTVGHALESLAIEKGEDVLHGEAIAWGLLCEYRLSMKLRSADPAPYNNLYDFISRNYQSLHVQRSDFQDILRYLQEDKKNKREQINFTLLKAIGEPLIDQYLGKYEIENCLKALWG